MIYELFFLVCIKAAPCLFMYMVSPPMPNDIPIEQVCGEMEDYINNIFINPYIYHCARKGEAEELKKPQKGEKV